MKIAHSHKGGLWTWKSISRDRGRRRVTRRLTHFHFLNIAASSSGKSLNMPSIVGDGRGLRFRRCLLYFLSDRRLRNRSADEQRAIQYIVLLRKAHDILLDAFSLEIDGNQSTVLLVCGDQRQDFVDGGNFLAGAATPSPSAESSAARPGNQRCAS